MKKAKRIGLLFLFLVGALVGGFFLGYDYSNFRQSKTQEIISPSKAGSASANQDLLKYTVRESSLGDFDGDGDSELALAFSKDEFFENDSIFKGYIAVFDQDGSEIAKTPDEFKPIETSIPGHMESYSFDEKSKKEYLRLISIAGSHHINNLFLGIRNGRLLPVCKMNVPDTLEDCIFYNSRGDLIIEDLDKDGLTEIAEMTDEYPPGGGRGRAVAWGIYSFNGVYFELQFGDNYDKLFNILAKDFNEPLMMRTDLSEASVENLEMVKRFWRGESK